MCNFESMRARIRVERAVGVVAFAFAVACADRPEPVESRPFDPPAVASLTAPAITRVDTLLRGLEVPWAVARTADGGLFVSERVGRIQYLAPGADSAQLWATLDVYANEEGIGPEAGLMGIALPPGGDGRVLYALATTWRTEGDRARSVGNKLWRRVAALVSPTGSLRFKNQVLRITRESDGQLRREVLVDDLWTNYYHAGGALAFGPDSALYFTLGDAIHPELARRGDQLQGKVLRVSTDGSSPSDAGGASVWAKGLRNTQALVWLADGTMLGVEHGPSGMAHEDGRAGMDELNLLRRGGDYGWPEVSGWRAAEGIESPLWVWEASVAPAGLAVLRDGRDGGPALLAVGSLRGQVELLQLTRSDDGWRVSGRGSVAQGMFGRIRHVMVESDSTLLLTTSNRDARGVARAGDDLLVRVTMDAATMR